MQCALYDAGRCRSCQWIEQPVPQQLTAKMADLQQLLAAHAVGEWCAPVSGPEQGFRNKAKMVVSGSVEKPLLGMLHRDGTPVDLTGCPLYPASFEPVFTALKPFIARAGLTPYNVARKRGEQPRPHGREHRGERELTTRFPPLHGAPTSTPRAA